MLRTCPNSKDCIALAGAHPKDTIQKGEERCIYTHGCEERTKEEAHQTESDGATDDVGLQPEDKLQADADDAVYQQHPPLPEPVGGLREEEPSC